MQYCDKVSFTNTAGTTITATAVPLGGTTTTTHTNSPTWEITQSGYYTARNLKNCLNANSELSVTHTGGKVTITQLGRALAGSSTITLTDSGSAI